jgi:tRNA uridine 5-carboxymethylaminomethyl modification enzyme
MELNRLASMYIQPSSPQAELLNAQLNHSLSREYSLADLLRRPELHYDDVADLVSESPITDNATREQVEIQIKYAGYIARQQDEIDRLHQQEATPIPVDLDYSSVAGLSNEICQKLADAKPTSIARASRISGVTPAALSLLLVHLKKRHQRPAVAHG